MKKSITIALAALMMLTASCKKNIVEKTDNENTNPIVQTENSSVAKLLKFKKQVEYYKANPNIKDGETMTVEEAVWNLENLFNITYTFPEYSYSELVTQEFELNLNSENGQIMSSEVAALYEEIKNESRTLYANDGFAENKGFLTLHAEMNNTRGGEVVNVKITTGARTNYNLPEPPQPYVDGPFVEGDDWVYGESLGKCDGTGGFSDAAQEITREINESISAAQPTASYGQRYAFINRISVDFVHNDDYPEVFYTTDPDETCIEWHDMNNYWYRYKRIVYVKIPKNEPNVQGLELTNVNIQGIGTYSFGVPDEMLHVGTAYYGERVSLDGTVFGDAMDIINN